MLPGLGGLNPKKMQAMMKQLGMSQEEIDALKVSIEKSDGNKIVIENPSVSKMNIQGQEMYQVSGGSVNEESAPIGISGEDIKTVVEKTGVTEEQAKKALEETKDLAEAIMQLS